MKANNVALLLCDLVPILAISLWVGVGWWLSVQDKKESERGFSLMPLLCAVGYGLLLGFIDIHLTRSDVPDNLMSMLYLAGAFVLGFCQPRTFWLSAIILALGLYSSHVVAMMNGVSFPYVARDMPTALICLLNVIPNTFFAAIGAGMRLRWNRLTRKMQHQ